MSASSAFGDLVTGPADELNGSKAPSTARLADSCDRVGRGQSSDGDIASCNSHQKDCASVMSTLLRRNEEVPSGLNCAVDQTAFNFNDCVSISRMQNPGRSQRWYHLDCIVVVIHPYSG
jgi:hypothetical protein